MVINGGSVTCIFGLRGAIPTGAARAERVIGVAVLASFSGILVAGTALAIGVVLCGANPIVAVARIVVIAAVVTAAVYITCARTVT